MGWGRGSQEVFRYCDLSVSKCDNVRKLLSQFLLKLKKLTISGIESKIY